MRWRRSGGPPIRGQAGEGTQTPARGEARAREFHSGAGETPPPRPLPPVEPVRGGLEALPHPQPRGRDAALQEVGEALLLLGVVALEHEIGRVLRRRDGPDPEAKARVVLAA